MMAIAMVADVPGLTREQYEAVVKKINQAGSPQGALIHAGGPTEGGYRIVEVWASREAADAFYGSEQYRAATAGIETQPNILMTWPVYGADTGSGWHDVA